jgi:peptide subunit release factor 1 (eRF1)
MRNREDDEKLRRERGISLESLGISDRALSLEDALAMVAFKARDGIPVLGGDVYRVSHEQLEMTKENWHCDQAPNEPVEQFVARSGQVATAFLKSFQKKGNEYFFTVVTREDRSE